MQTDHKKAQASWTVLQEDGGSLVYSFHWRCRIFFRPYVMTIEDEKGANMSSKYKNTQHKKC